jgi:SAM-dependent methyltransferase
MKLRFPLRAYKTLDRLYLHYDKKMIRRTRNLWLMPGLSERSAPGRPSYGEWCYLVGIFQTLLRTNLKKDTDNDVLDVGCGTGIMAIASQPFLGDKGHYTGIDVKRSDIEFCRQHYPNKNFSFIHLDASNQVFAPDQSAGKVKWEVADASADVVTALSVWTHMNEDDAIFYFREIDRVLKPGGKAIVTFYLLDDLYHSSVSTWADKMGRYNNSFQNSRIFNTPSSQSKNWFHPDWAAKPEETIGVTPAGIQMMLDATRLSLVETYVGNWKEVPGVFYQDILVFEKH